MKPPNKTHNVFLQPRDIALIRTLAQDFLLLTSEQIAELFPMGTLQRQNFRLRQLSAAGYLSSRKLKNWVSVFTLGHYLGPRAPALFKHPTEQRLAYTTRSKAAQLSLEALPHRIMVDTVHIRFLTASRHNPNYRLHTWVDQYSPDWIKLHKYGVPVQADAYGEYILLLHFDNLHTFFLEVDRGTERGKTIQDKIDRYIKFAQSGTYERLFVAKPFRVLLIVHSHRRKNSLLKFLNTKSSRIFWVTT